MGRICKDFAKPLSLTCGLWVIRVTGFTYMGESFLTRICIRSFMRYPWLTRQPIGTPHA